jgi:hypothetical protein
MSYYFEQTEQGNSIVIDGFEKGIAPSPYLGIANIRNFNTSYYPGVAYTNYRRQAATLTTTSDWYAGTHSTDVSNNSGWIFSAPPAGATMNNPVSKAVSPDGLIYIQDSDGNIWKQTAVNGTTFAQIDGGTGRFASGNAGIAYWNNYLVVFGDNLIEFCGDGTGDAGIIDTNWNLTTTPTLGSYSFVTNYGTYPTRIIISSLIVKYLAANDQVTFSTTGTLPAPLATGTTYYVITATSNYITVSATCGGTEITLTNDGTGTHTVTNTASTLSLPLGNCTSVVLASSSTGTTTFFLQSYVNPKGQAVGSVWQEASGIYTVTFTSGETTQATFTNGSYVVTLATPKLYFGSAEALTGATVKLIDTTVTNYKPYVSKVSGNLLFCNGNMLSEIIYVPGTNIIPFNPGSSISPWSVNIRAISVADSSETLVDVVDLKDNLVIATERNIFTWDYVSGSTSSPSPVAELISSITNVLNNIYILAGEKGNIYVSNGYSAQLFYKMPDYIAGVIDPVWKWGGLMSHRSRLFFQALVQTTSGSNVLAGIFSLIVSPSLSGEKAEGLVMEAQNSYGLTPSSGATQAGLLIDNSPSANGNDSYYSVWSNGATTGGIDYNDTTLWQNWEPTIETDIIPIGTILDKKTFGNIEFKLDRPLASGDQIRLYARTSLSDSYTLLGTTTTAQLSDYYQSNIFQSQWVQFKIQTKCASSSSSFIPLREVRLNYN